MPPVVLLPALKVLLATELGLLLSLDTFAVMLLMAAYLYYCISQLTNAPRGKTGWHRLDPTARGRTDTR